MLLSFTIEGTWDADPLELVSSGSEHEQLAAMFQKKFETGARSAETLLAWHRRANDEREPKVTISVIEFVG